MFVDDATEAFLRAGANDDCNGEVYNVSGGEPISLRDLATLLLDVAGGGRVTFVDWPPEKRAIDIGSFYASSEKFRQATGWRAETGLRDGLSRTVEFYRQHIAQYVPSGSAQA